MVIVSINLTEKHKKFIDEQSRKFVLSKFIQDKLDEYMEMKERLKDEKTIG